MLWKKDEKNISTEQDFFLFIKAWEYMTYDLYGWVFLF